MQVLKNNCEKAEWIWNFYCLQCQLLFVNNQVFKLTKIESFSCLVSPKVNLYTLFRSCNVTRAYIFFLGMAILRRILLFFPFFNCLWFFLLVCLFVFCQAWRPQCVSPFHVNRTIGVILVQPAWSVKLRLSECGYRRS